MNSRSPGSTLILGARSDIGRAIARRYAMAGVPVLLAARESATLEADAQDLRLRHSIKVVTVEFDATQSDPTMFFDSFDELPDTVISVVGLLGVQSDAEKDVILAAAILDVNFAGPARILNEAARRMQARGAGCIIGISSVAGDRGRASNYFYGSAKAAFTSFLSGLRNRLAKYGVRVITVKPGFVETKMTAGMKLPPHLTASPAEIADAIFRAQSRGRDVIYVKPVWRLLMTVICLIPESIFKRLSL